MKIGGVDDINTGINSNSNIIIPLAPFFCAYAIDTPATAPSALYAW